MSAESSLGDSPDDDERPVDDEPPDTGPVSTDTSVQPGNPSCPLWSSVLRDVGALFQHINSNHTTRHGFPDVSSLRLIIGVYVPSVHGFLYGKRFTSCRRSLGHGHSRCCGLMEVHGNQAKGSAGDC